MEITFTIVKNEEFIRLIVIEDGQVTDIFEVSPNIERFIANEFLRKLYDKGFLATEYKTRKK
jgi:hypothetical protein